MRNNPHVVPWLGLAILLTMMHFPAYSQWVQTNGPGTGFIDDFAVIGSTVFAASHNTGVFMSSDYGLSWNSINNDLPTKDISYICATEAMIFVGSHNHGVYRSSNKGVNWTLATSGMTNTNIEGLAAVGATVFAATWGGGVFRSTDNGATWTDAGVKNPWVTSLSVSQTSFGSATLLAGAADLYPHDKLPGVYVSPNAGATWSNLLLYLSPINAIAAVDSLIFVGSAGVDGGLRRTTDKGTTWASITAGLTDSVVTSIVLTPKGTTNMTVFVGTRSAGIYKSTDLGIHWSASNAGLSNLDIESLRLLSAPGGAVLLAGTAGSGIFRSTDLGATWIRTGVPASSVNVLATLPGRVGGTNLFAATDDQNGNIGGLSKADVEGLNWSPVMGEFKDRGITTMTGNSAAILLGTNGDGIYRSSDDGAHFRPSSSGLTNFIVNSIISVNDAFYAGTNDGLFRSIDNGVTWSPVNTNFSNRIFNCLSAISTGSNSATLLAGTYPFGIYRSADDGATWTQVLFVSAQRIAVLAGTGTSNTVFESSFSGNAGNQQYGLNRSTDNGTTWLAADSGFKNTQVHDFAVSGSCIFAATARGVFMSSDMGISWRPLNTGLPSVNSLCIAIRGAFVYVGIDSNGVWRRPLSDVISLVQYRRSEQPSSFLLEQNYPNPFNPSTAISYQLSAMSVVTLKVMDVLGREVATIVDGQKAAGYYTTQWNASGVPSGTYFYRLIAQPVGNRKVAPFVETRKLSLIR